MDLQKEKLLAELTKKLSVLDRQIIKHRLEKGTEDLSARKQFIEIEEEVKKILSQSSPLDEIQNPEVRETLRRVRDRNYFVINKEEVKLEKLVKAHPQLVEEILKRNEIEVSESEIDEELNKKYIKFQDEIESRISPIDYFERKEKFSTLIVNTRLPKKVHTYFFHIKDCFLLDQMFAVVGLCRVLLELAFKDRYQKLGLSKSQGNVYYIDDKNISLVIREVCNILHLRIHDEAKELYYDISSQILHGRDPKIKMTSEEVLNFIRRVFGVIEKLYAR